MNLVAVHLYYINKRRISNTHKSFKMSLKHISIYYVPSSGIVMKEVLKPTANSIYSRYCPCCVHCCSL